MKKQEYVVLAETDEMQIVLTSSVTIRYVDKTNDFKFMKQPSMEFENAYKFFYGNLAKIYKELKQKQLNN